MYLTTEIKKKIFADNSPLGTGNDTGTPEVQIALFTFRINHLNQHLKKNTNDKSTKLGLLKLVGKRRSLLDYLIKTDISRYRLIIQKLGIRK